MTWEVSELFHGANRSSEITFFTTFVTLIRWHPDGSERRMGSPARVESHTLRLPIGTDVRVGDYVETSNDYGPTETAAARMMVVIDVIHPYMPGSSAVADHIEVTCVPSKRVAIPALTQSTLHPAIAGPLALVADGRMSEAVREAMRLVERRVQALTASVDSGPKLMESVFGTDPPRLDITTTTGPAAKDERDGFRLLFMGAMLGLDRHGGGAEAVPAAVDEALEYLAVASMLMRRLDHAESRLA